MKGGQLVFCDLGKLDVSANMGIMIRYMRRDFCAALFDAIRLPAFRASIFCPWRRKSCVVIPHSNMTFAMNSYQPLVAMDLPLITLKYFQIGLKIFVDPCWF